MRAKICILLAMTLLLSGCTNPFAEGRDIERLLVIQTMGLDNENGSVRLSLASAAEGGGTEPHRLSATGGSITAAMQRIHNSSYEQELFCSHVRSVLIGEHAADEGIDPYLRYICRSPIMRIDVPMYIVKGGTASELITEAGDGQRGISEILNNVRLKLSARGGEEFTSADIMRGMLRNGSALVRALELTPASEAPTQDAATDNGEYSETAEESAPAETPSETQTAGETPYTAAIAGYAVIREGKLCRYINEEDSLAADILLGRGGIYDIELNDEYGGTVVLELSSPAAAYRPIWDGAGLLTGMEVKLTAQYSVLETNGRSDLDSADYIDRLTATLETELLGRVGHVLDAEAELKADFLGLAEYAERSAPELSRAVRQSFTELLPGLEMQVTVSCRLQHMNDMKDV